MLAPRHPHRRFEGISASSLAPLVGGLLLVGALLLGSTPAFAQAALGLSRVPTDGLVQPASSASFTDGPQASSTNPAGLHFIDGLTLRYLHQEGLSGELQSPNGDGLYLGGKLFSPIGWGVSVEWLRNNFGADARRTTWALALGGEAAAIGANVHTFSSDTPALDGVASVDLGAMARPARWLSLGFAVRDVDGSRVAGVRMPRRFVMAAGVRPLGDWLTVALDAEVPAGKNTPIETGWDATLFSWTSRARISDGVTLLGALSHRVDGTGPVSGQLGLALDFAHLGLEATPLLASHGADPGVVVAADLRARPAPHALKPRQARVAMVDLDEALRSSPGLQLFPSTARQPMVDLIEGLHRLADDEEVEAVLVRIRSLPIGVGQAWEIRRALLDLRARGKKVAAYLGSADDTEYWVASGADQIFVAPEASLSVNGFSSRVNFFGDTLKSIGIDVQVARVGAYKNFPDSFTAAEISEAQQEVVESLLDSLFEGYVRDVTGSRGFSPERFKEILATGLQSAREAKDLGLADEVVWSDELPTALSRMLGRPISIQDVRPKPERWTSWGPAPIIAIIPIEGTIVSGRGGGGFGLMQTTGDEVVVGALERAAADPNVRAIVLRIDSGGGDAAASQRIWRAVLKARERKPVIASLADQAASGGYFAAAGAQRIFAAPSTFTGSIGVFWIKPSFADLLGTLQVNSYSSQRGEKADIQSLQKPWSPVEQEVVQKWVDAAYRDFVEAVASGRNLKIDEVDQVARGRVWTGAQAFERQLVDDLGGLSEALRSARDASGVGASPVQYRVYRPSSFLISVGASGLAFEKQAFEPSWPQPLAAALREGIPAPLLLSSEAGIWALTPWNFEVR